jgi:hypothetical protein
VGLPLHRTLEVAASRDADVVEVRAALVVRDRDLPADFAAPRPALLTVLRSHGGVREDLRDPDDPLLRDRVHDELLADLDTGALVEPDRVEIHPPLEPPVGHRPVHRTDELQPASHRYAVASV